MSQKSKKIKLQHIIQYNQMNQIGNMQMSPQQYNYYYYQEYKKLYMASFVLSAQMKQLLKTKDQLMLKLSKLEKKTEQFHEESKLQSEEKKKRFRRTAAEISRNYKCMVQKCQKLYGSEGSLHQHIKLKHPQLYVNQQSEKYNKESQQ